MVCADDVIRLEHLPQAILRRRDAAQAEPTPAARPDPAVLDADGFAAQVSALDRARIVDALARAGGNQTQAAKLLGMSRRTLISRLETLALPRPRKGNP